MPTANIGLLIKSATVDLDKKPRVNPEFIERARLDIEASAQNFWDSYKSWARSERRHFEKSPLPEMQRGSGSPTYSTSQQYDAAYQRALQRAALCLQHNRSDYSEQVQRGGIALANRWRIEQEEEQRRKEQAEAEAARRKAERERLLNELHPSRKEVDRELRLIHRAHEAEQRIAQFARDLNMLRQAEAARKRLAKMRDLSAAAAQRLRWEFGEKVEEPTFPAIPQAPEEAVEFVRTHDFMPPL